MNHNIEIRNRENQIKSLGAIVTKTSVHQDPNNTYEYWTEIGKINFLYNGHTYELIIERWENNIEYSLTNTILRWSIGTEKFDEVITTIKEWSK